jgi:hypothetical protein
MARDTYDAADPGPAPQPDPERDPPPGPACPYCGGGPAVATPLGPVCKSCAHIIRSQP